MYSLLCLSMEKNKHLVIHVKIFLFSVTIQNVQKQSQQLWRYQRFLLVLEYSAKPPLPPPFNPIYYLFSGTRCLIKRMHASWRRRRDGMLDNTSINNHFLL